MQQFHKCATCGRNDIKLFRSAGGFLHDDEIFCYTHCPRNTDLSSDFIKKCVLQTWYVPCIEDTDGSIWGYTSVPTKDIVKWNALEPVGKWNVETWNIIIDG